MTTATATTPDTTLRGTRQPVDLWFDATCPWAWMTSRWLLEVEKVRDIEIRWHFMSLSVLNEGRELAKGYQALMDKAWLPARVITAASVLHGPEVVGPLYTAIGTRIHPGGQKNFREAVAGGLADVGLPADLIQYGDTDTYDAQLRASHADGINRVGQDVGTPVIAVADTAFFGPIVTPAPKGEAAGKLWDGVLAVAQTPGFYELKRTRDARPDFS